MNNTFHNTGLTPDNSASSTINMLNSVINEQTTALRILNEEMSKMMARIRELEDMQAAHLTNKTPRIEMKVVHVEEQKKKQDVAPGPKILIYGITKMRRVEMLDIIQNRLLNSYNIHVKKGDVVFMTADNKDTLKNESPVNNLKSGNYDYMIVGPQPHSIKGKNLKHTWTQFLSYRKIDTTVFEGYKKPISKEDLLRICDKIGKDLFRPVLPGTENVNNEINNVS
jgi:hypothetical protein